MGFMAALTVFALLVIAGFVKEISKVPTVARPAALTATAHTTRHTAPRTTGSRSPRPKPSPSAAAAAQGILDASSGLSYSLLSAPWRQGCPSILNTPVFTWTAGESAVAGQADIGGTMIDWHGNACSGQLDRQFTYTGPADLEPVTISVAAALESTFYNGLQDYPTVEGSFATQVSGQPAWVVTFLMTYPDAASEDLAWTSEDGAVVVVDRGAGQAPALFYVSVPNDLGTGTVDTLINSLRLT
jgi:hypothetical protein